MDNYYPSSLNDGSNDVLGLKRPLNGPSRLTNSPLNSANTSNQAANYNRLFQQYPPSLSIPSIYQNPNLFTSSPTPNSLSNLNHLNLSNLASSNKSLPIDRQDYFDSLNATTRDSIISSSLNANAHQLNHRRRPSLLQSAAYSNEFGGLQPQYLPYLSEPLRENINRNLLARNKATLLPQHYQSLNASLNPSLLNSPFSAHLNLAQSAPPLNFLQSSQTHSYLENCNNETNKRPRLSSVQPLLIDTNTIEIKKEPAYTVQVEAISPTPNEDSSRADASPTKTTKDDILQQINQIDREITQTENQMSKLKRKQQEIEASNKAGKSTDPNEYLESKQQSLTQVIYFENRKKTNDSQKLLEKLGPKVILPIYNQPSDTKIYHDNKEKFVKFKSILQQHFKRKLRRKQQREIYLTETYDTMMQEWLHKLESKDSNPTKKSKDNKLREFFEKQFPELKKTREDKERLSRAGQRVRSDADLEDIMDGIQEQELEDKKIRAYAVIPPILHDEKEHNYRFKTNNCKIDDPVREHKELTYLNVWTDMEKEIFKEKFLQAPKNFGLIASYLENKSVMDCVQYYYSSKKRENYKQLLRKNAKKRTRALAKAQQAAQQIQRNLARNRQLEVEKENLLVSKTNTSADNRLIMADDKSRPSSKTPPSMLNTIKEEPQPLVAQDDENCLKCINCLQKIEPNSKFYMINRANCFLYGISMEDVKRESRLCKVCKNKFGTGECPVPSCEAIKKPIRRLKTLPREWFELTPENRYTFEAELNFPLDCKRCCTRCWIRLVRKYSSSFIKNTPIKNYHTSTMRKFLNCVWEDSEIEKLKNAIRKNGRDWEVISSSHVVTKTAKQCRQFYFYFKYNLNLDELMKMTTFQTDDFDSDTCWKEIASDDESSEDEYLIERKISDSNLDKVQDNKKMNLSQLKIETDSNISMEIESGVVKNNLAGNELDYSRITSPVSHFSSSIVTDIKLRPSSKDNFDMDSKFKELNYPKYLQKQSSVKPPAQMPSFVKYLINPNAPTVPSTINQNKPSSSAILRQDSPTILTPVNTPSTVSLTPSPLNTPLNSNSNLNQQQQLTQASKDNKTCVRDLIHHTIDLTFQTDKSSTNNNNKSSIDQQTKDVKPTNSTANIQSLHFPQDASKIVPNVGVNTHTANPALQHIISPFNLNLSPLINSGLSTTLNSTTTSVHINEIENEVQDLSKKSTTKKEPDTSDYHQQPKNYSLAKSNISMSTPYNTGMQSTSGMPPPAHLSSRTSTPGLESDQQQQLQNFYLNNLNNLHNLNSLQNVTRHSDSPQRTRGLTPNHLITNPSNSQSPTPNNRSNSNQAKVNINAPPPLIANSLINSQQQYSINNSSTASSKQSSHQGSITQGTPVHLNQQQQQYLLNKEREAAVGSITLGTPLYRSNSRTNMPKLISSSTNFMPGQNQTPFNLQTTFSNPILNQNLSIGKESVGNQLSSTQSQIMIDFNTSKQMQKRSNLPDSNKERNSPLSINRLTNQFQPPTSIPGYPTTGLPLGFNPVLFVDAQKAVIELTKSQSPLLIESTKANSPKISQSSNARQNLIYGQAPINAAAYLAAQQQLSQAKNSPSVIQTSATLQQLSNSGTKTPSNVLPLYSQANDTFQNNLLTLVNTAAAQKNLMVPNESNKKSLTMNEEQLKEEDKNNFFNQSMLKFARNPFTKEQFDKEMKNQEELVKIQKQQQQLIDEQQSNAMKNERNKLSKYDLEASAIFSSSFQKDNPTPSQRFTAANLIDAIICRQINQPESTKSLSQKDKFNQSVNSNLQSSYPTSSSFINDQLKNYMNEQLIPTNQSISALHLLHPTTGSGTKLSDDLFLNDQNWKLRKALEPKDSLNSRNKDNSSGTIKIESHIELEPISPPSSTPTKEQQSQQYNNIPTSLANIQMLSNVGQMNKNISNLSQLPTVDPMGFHQFFQNANFQSRIAQAMNVEQVQSDKEEMAKKKIKLENEIGNIDEMQKESNKIVGLESISSLSELKAQKAEFQKQQQIKLSIKSTDVDKKD